MRIIGHIFGAIFATLLFGSAFASAAGGDGSNGDAAAAAFMASMLVIPVAYVLVVRHVGKRRASRRLVPPVTPTSGGQGLDPTYSDVANVFRTLSTQEAYRRWRPVDIWAEAQRRVAASAPNIVLEATDSSSYDDYYQDPGYVYLMQLGDMDITKLGISRYEHKRVEAHATHGWRHIKTWLVDDYADARAIETSVHAHADSMGARPKDDAMKSAMPQGGYTEVMTLPPGYVRSLVSGQLREMAGV